jgi:hypothetical protein
MSEEEDIETTIEEPKTIEEQLAPENVKPTTLNKNGKPRKQLSPEHLEKLQKARAKANAIRKQNSIKKLEDKIENINKQTEPILGAKPKKEKELEVINEVIEEEQTEVKERKKKSTKKKTKIIIEQSSDDSDQFESNDNVVFVKRVSRKKKEPVEPPPVEKQQAYEQPPPQPPPKPPMKPQLTPQQMMLRDNYNAMFSGNFINQNGMRRHY